MDVVPPGNIDAWRTPPFEPVVKDSALWGRGSLDDKGAIVACLYALNAVMELGNPFKKKVQMVLGTQEEVDWTDMQAYVEEFPLPDYGFTPDGEFPLCNIEKGVMDLELVFPLDESKEEGLFLIALNGGSAANIVPDQCSATLLRRMVREDGTFGEETILLTGEGLSVHSCQPEKGDNAIINLCKRLKELPLVSNNAYKLVLLLRERCADTYCRGVDLYSKEEYLNGEYIHRNTMTVTMIKTEQNAIEVNINVRFSYGTSEEEIIQAFKKVAAEGNGYIKNCKSLPAVYISKKRPFMKVFGDAYETITGLKNEFTLAYGGSYAKAMENIVSWGPLFPGEEDTCHEENEHILIESLMLNAQIFAEAISRIVLTDNSFK